MSVYLIDYENVNFSGLEGVAALNEGDEVVLFYSDSSSTIPMNLHIDVQKSGATMRYIEIRKTAKNYLDFQLAALSGYLVGTTDQTEFIVISRDTGFDSVLDREKGSFFKAGLDWRNDPCEAEEIIREVNGKEGERRRNEGSECCRSKKYTKET